MIIRKMNKPKLVVFDLGMEIDDGSADIDIVYYKIK